MPLGIRGASSAGFACLLLLALSTRSAAVTSAEGPLFGPTPPRFAADFSASLDSTGRPMLLVEVQVPYAECQFVRVAAGLGAALELTVVVDGGGGRQVAGDVWEHRFVLATFDATKDAAARVTETRSFAVPPGKYRLKVTVRDLNGGLTSAAERALTIAGLGKETLGLGDIVFGECGPDSSAPESGFVRNAARRYAESLRRFCVRSLVLDLRPGGEARTYRVHYRVRDENGEDRATGDTLLAARAARPFLLRPDVTGLFLGSYVLEVTVEEGGRRWKAEAGFDIDAVTVPRGREWTTFLEILEYVASPTDLAPLRKAETAEERMGRWQEFWARRDPTPDTPRNEALLEFMCRVRYANSQFAGLGPGWRSDQGKVYIRYGAPDQIEDLPATATSPPLQVWHYFGANRRFVFADRQGFGHYELLNEGGL